MMAQIDQVEKKAKGASPNFKELIEALEIRANVLNANSQVYQKLVEKSEKPTAGANSSASLPGLGNGTFRVELNDKIHLEAWNASMKWLNGDLHKPGVKDEDLTGPERLLKKMTPRAPIDLLADPKALREQLKDMRDEMGKRGKEAAKPMGPFPFKKEVPKKN